MAGIDTLALADILRDAAKAEILPRFRRLDTGMVQTKSEAIDLVTEADTEAERFIKARIAAIASDAVVVGEESVAAEPALLHAVTQHDLVITVDPVDGTANFAAGLPLYAVMAAVVTRGEVTAGIIYDPMGDDWFIAEKGSGAFQRRPDGTQSRVNAASGVPLGQLIGTASVAFLPAAQRPTILANLAKIRMFANYRVAGHEYRLISSGHTHFAMFNKMMPWDHLPGTLIAQEAGAYVAKLDGSPYRPGELEGGILSAADRDTWEVLRREVFTS